MFKVKRLFPLLLALSAFWTNESSADDICYYNSYADHNNYYSWPVLISHGVQTYTCLFGNAALVSLQCDAGYQPNDDFFCEKINNSKTIVNIEAEAYGGASAKVYLNGAVVCSVSSGAYFDTRKTCKVTVDTASGVEFDLSVNGDTGGWGNGCDDEKGDSCILDLDGTPRTIGFDAMTEPDD